MENYYFDQSINKWIGIYDKRLSIPFYDIWTKPLLIYLRKCIVDMKNDKAEKVLKDRIDILRRNLDLNNNSFNIFFDELSEHIIQFLSSYEIGINAYYHWKNMIESDYRTIIKVIVERMKITLENQLVEYFFNVFFDIEKYVSNDIYKRFETHYVLLDKDFIYGYVDREFIFF